MARWASRRADPDPRTAGLVLGAEPSVAPTGLLVGRMAGRHAVALLTLRLGRGRGLGSHGLSGELRGALVREARRQVRPAVDGSVESGSFRVIRRDPAGAWSFDGPSRSSAGIRSLLAPSILRADPLP